jgi:hypothetical protein
MFWKSLNDFLNPPPRKTPAEIEADRRQRLIDECSFGHYPGALTMPIHPMKRDRLSCMFCPCDLPLPKDYRIKRGGSLGGGWDTVEVG